MKRAFVNIKELFQVRPEGVGVLRGESMSTVPSIVDAYLVEVDGVISGYGPMSEYTSIEGSEIEEIDCSGRMVLPGFVDSHTHLVYAASRENEFVDKINGLSYEEIAKRGGGILNSAKRLQQTTEEELFQLSLPRAQEIMGLGTCAVEIKSGYGLTTEDELKMLRVARRIGEETSLRVRTTFLGAHAVPKDRDREDYLKEIEENMIPKVAEERLADYCDVFCEKGFFSPEESEHILEVAKKHELVPKVHANQLYNSGGVEVGVKVGAISVDHLEVVEDEQIAILRQSETIGTMLPGAAFYLNSVYPPARKMITEGVAVSVASDYNPGSAPAGNMALMMSLACIKMRMRPEEALNAVTINAAHAMDMNDHVGSITVGKDASLIVTKDIPSLAFMQYAFGSNVIEQVWIRGNLVK